MANFDVYFLPSPAGTELTPRTGTGTTFSSITYKSFQMRAYNTVTSAYVFWTSYGYPDVTGSNSGYTPANLTNITVMTQGT